MMKARSGIVRDLVRHQVIRESLLSNDKFYIYNIVYISQPRSPSERIYTLVEFSCPSISHPLSLQSVAQERLRRGPGEPRNRYEATGVGVANDTRDPEEHRRSNALHQREEETTALSRRSRIRAR